MNSNIFTYSLLHYVHSQSSGESLNVGILFIFPNQKEIIFQFPSKLSRLSNTYRNFPEWLVKAHLKGIKHKAQQISTDWNLFSDTLLPDTLSRDTWAFISKELLIEDATALQFGQLRVGVLDTTDLQGLTQNYYKLYFGDYEDLDVKPSIRNERYINQKLYKSLITKNKAIDKFLQKDVEVRSPELTLKFDYGWQNHQFHLVKPLAFDLETEDGIQEKSARNFGYLTLLSQTAIERDYTFDLIVTRPSNTSLFRAYDKALKVLDSIKVSKSIVEEPQIEAYTNNILEAITE